MIKINPGELNRKVTVYQEDLSPDGGGGQVESWETKGGWKKVCDVWASIRPASEKAVAFAGQLQIEVTHTVLVRYTEAIKEKYAIDYQGRRLNVRTIRNLDEADQYLQLFCHERKR